MADVETRIKNALETISHKTWWKKLFAENISIAACEGFLQATLLQPFNVDSQKVKLVADREKQIPRRGEKKGGVKPDLLLFTSPNWEVFCKMWKKLEKTSESRSLLAQKHMSAAVEIKYTANNTSITSAGWKGLTKGILDLKTIRKSCSTTLIHGFLIFVICPSGLVNGNEGYNKKYLVAGKKRLSSDEGLTLEERADRSFWGLSGSPKANLG